MLTFTNIDEHGNVDNSFCHIEDTSENLADLMSLYSKFSFYIPGYKFMPAYTRGTWDGMYHVINVSKRLAPIGILDKILDFCETINIQTCNKVYRRPVEASREQLEAFYSQYEYYSKGKQISPREDQIEAVYRSLLEGRCINVCPTSFGKSLCIYMQCQYFTKNIGKVLIIVPNVALVQQMKSDFLDYANGEPSFNIYTISAGVNKYFPKYMNVIITTWQSIYKLDAEYFSKFQCIICDEVHRSTAPKLTDIMNKCSKIAFRTGWTGSLQRASVNELLVESLFGSSKKITDILTLMEKKIIANLKLIVVRLKYSGEYCNASGIIDYTEEIRFLENYKIRTQKIALFAEATKNTGLIIFNHIKHGEKIAQAIKTICFDRNIYLLYGGHIMCNDKKYKSLEEIKPLIENDKNGIIIASLKYFGEGISIKNFHWLMFAIPFKSFVQVIQSIGRGLRVSDTKHKLMLFDIVDDMCKRTKNNKIQKQNYAYKHFLKRLEIYTEEGFVPQTLTMNI